MLPFQPPFLNQNQLRGGNDPSLNRLPSSANAAPNQFGPSNPQMLMPMMGELHNQNALLGTLLAQQQLIQGLQNNLMSALSQQGLIPQFHGQQINLLGGLQNPNLMSLQQTGLLGRPPSSHNLNQVMGCPPNGFRPQQNPNFAPNSQIPVISSGNPNPAFLGNRNPQVVQSISNSPCLKTQLASQNIKEPIMTTPVQNNQSSGRQWPQLTHTQVGGKSSSYNSSDNVASNNFKMKFNGSVRLEPAHVRYQKPQTYNPRNTWKKEGSFSRNDRRGQRPRNQRNTKLPENNNTFMRKRPLAVIYNESEVQQWRESRKKNFPTRANIEKKLSSKEDMDFDAKALRQQLREVLAKQAELGFEVAEIPPIYLTEPEEQASRNTNANKPSNMDTQTPNNHLKNKRGRFQRDNRNAKRRKFKGAHEPVVKKREPTLLRKLLNADLRRDKSQLLQAFRFMVLNSFFTSSPGTPLDFPLITAKDAHAPDLEAAALVGKQFCRNGVSLLQDTCTLDSDVVVAEELPQNDVDSVGKNENGEGVESDSDDMDGASDVVCEAVADDFAAGGEKSEEGEITE